MPLSARKCLHIIHGPNLNLLGSRQPELYGAMTLDKLDQSLVAVGKMRGYDVSCFQSNHEGALVDAIHHSRQNGSGIVINAAAYSHSSIAIRDALLAVGLPVVEVHLTNIHSREKFRQKSMIADIAIGVMSGFGPDSYVLGLFALANHLEGTVGIVPMTGTKNVC